MSPLKVDMRQGRDAVQAGSNWADWATTAAEAELRKQTTAVQVGRLKLCSDGVQQCNAVQCLVGLVYCLAGCMEVCSSEREFIDD